MNLQYLIDANIFITASRTYYDFDFGNSFWNFLVEQAKNGKLASIDKVLDELNKGDDKLKKWANNQRNQYSQNAIDEFMKENNADTWLVALALTNINKYVIVTFEKENNQIKRKIPIPNVCKAFNIEYYNLFQMLKKMEFKF